MEPKPSLKDFFDEIPTFVYPWIAILGLRIKDGQIKYAEHKQWILLGFTGVTAYLGYI